jgi:hypothetical protein
MAEATDQVWEWLKANKLHMDIEQVELKDIESVWQVQISKGKEL